MYLLLVRCRYFCTQITPEKHIAVSDVRERKREREREREGVSERDLEEKD